jgi:hypothetical protein
MVNAPGCAFTVTVAVCEHPLLFVYVITLVPADTPVTRPVELTVATLVVADSHGDDGSGVPEPVNCVVAAMQVVNVPVIDGSGFIVIVNALPVLEQPDAFLTVSVPL